MKRLYFLFLALMVSVPTLAAETGEVKKQVTKEQQQEKQKKSSEQLPHEQKQAPVNNTFHPTEKIEADTVISFPADI